jgi:GNAT superfamily N-acetyltransferase
MAFWCADPADHPLTQDQIDRVRFALVHEAALPIFSQREFVRRQPYFRLSHSGSIRESLCPAGFVLQPVRPETDLDAVVGLLCACYPTFNINIEIVRGWLEHPVYDPELWLWVIDLASGEKAGLGIAERDSQVPEASLEWIQVLPAYRGMGLGKAIVTALVQRASADVRFTTVSGEISNVHQPEKLYRRCGFTGEDVWWLLNDE